MICHTYFYTVHCIRARGGGVLALLRVVGTPYYEVGDFEPHRWMVHVPRMYRHCITELYGTFSVHTVLENAMPSIICKSENPSPSRHTAIKGPVIIGSLVSWSVGGVCTTGTVVGFPYGVRRSGYSISALWSLPLHSCFNYGLKEKPLRLLVFKILVHVFFWHKEISK